MPKKKTVIVFDILTLKPEYTSIGMKRDNESKAQRLTLLYRVIGLRGSEVINKGLEIVNNKLGRKYRDITFDDFFFGFVAKRQNRYRCIKGKRFFVNYHRHFNEAEWKRENSETEVIDYGYNVNDKKTDC